MVIKSIPISKINVEYDENIFTSQPSIEAGSHAWMKVKGEGRP
jgi:hypothetical protein